MKRIPVDEAKTLYLDGLTVHQIGERLGFSGSGVWKSLVNAGVTMRPNGPIDRPWARKNRGEEYVGKDGRWWIRLPNGGRKRRAVFRMEQKLGKPVPKGYHVHHKDEDVGNDDPGNLELKKAGKHLSDHNRGKKNPKKGRRAEAHPRAKLTWDIVRQIRALKGKQSQELTASQFGLHQTMVGKIQRNESWIE